MIGTHTTKLVNARAKQDAVCANIVANLDRRYITSKTVRLTKQHWACPYNAADMRKWRESNYEPVLILPEIQDGRAVKQVLLPLNDWRDNKYVAVSPLESLGLLHELYLRANQTDVQRQYFQLEPTPAARANHGELMLAQSGAVCLLTRSITSYVEPTDDTTSCVAVKFEAQNANINSGFFSLGHPAITAVGGLVHTIERAINQDVHFALGIDDIYRQKQRRYSRHNPATKKTVWGITTEMTAHVHVTLLLKCDDLGGLYEYLKKRPLNRFAGGSIWDYQVELISDSKPPASNYVVNAANDTDIDTDSLDAALRMYQEVPPTHSVNQVGYAYLESPVQRENVRNNYPHAWAESIYSVVKQSGFSEDAWWERQSFENYTVWI